MGAPRVDFYLPEGSGGDARLRLFCRLIDKAHAARQHTLMLGSDRQELLALDELLWTSLDGSFIPHDVLAEDGHAAPEARVVLASRVPEPFPRELLINLGPAVPPEAAQFSRVIEVPGADPTSRQLARERFRAYRRLGAEPTTHQIGTQPAPARPL